MSRRVSLRGLAVLYGTVCRVEGGGRDWWGEGLWLDER